MKNILILLLLIWANESFAQKVISSNGATATAAGYEVSWTIGEAVIATVSDANNTLTQGFHQSKLTVTAINELSVTDIEIKVYPNPTSDFVTIHFSKIVEKPRYLLFDLSGKLLEQKNIDSSDAKINMAGFAEGVYILKLNHLGSLPLQTFKIIKR